MSHSNGHDDTRQLLVNGVADAVGFVGGALHAFGVPGVANLKAPHGRHDVVIAGGAKHLVGFIVEHCKGKAMALLAAQ